LIWNGKSTRLQSSDGTARLTFISQTTAVCHGAAVAVANKMTLEEFLKPKPAIGCLVSNKNTGVILLNDFENVS
jgi:hypothetical protein